MTDRRALTILFADVSGSTRLFESRGDEVALWYPPNPRKVQRS